MYETSVDQQTPSLIPSHNPPKFSYGTKLLIQDAQLTVDILMDGSSRSFGRTFPKLLVDIAAQERPPPILELLYQKKRCHLCHATMNI